jgi:hypothetical protein
MVIRGRCVAGLAPGRVARFGGWGTTVPAAGCLGQCGFNDGALIISDRGGREISGSGT